MTTAVFIAGYILSFTVPPAALAFFLKRKKNWSAHRKKWIFAISSAFLAFPILIPAGFIAVIPMPNIFVLTLALFLGDVSAIWELPLLYGQLWQFTLPSILITALLYRGVAAMIFYERKLANSRK